MSQTRSGLVLAELGRERRKVRSEPVVQNGTHRRAQLIYTIESTAVAGQRILVRIEIQIAV